MPVNQNRSNTGLVGLNIGSQADPLQDVSGYESERVAMGDEDSVEKRVARLSSGGSPIIRLNQTQTRQNANRGGRLNTSMTDGEVLKAGIETALPIAQADAGTSAAYKLANQQEGNLAGRTNAAAINAAKTTIGEGNIQSNLQREGYEQDLGRITAGGDVDSRLQGEGYQQDLGRIDAGADADARLSALGFTHDSFLQSLKGDQAENLTRIEAENARLIQASASAGTIFSNYMQSMGEILANPDLSTATKQALIDQMIPGLESALHVEGALAGVDLAGLLDFGGADTGTGGGAGTGTGTGTGTGGGAGRFNVGLGGFGGGFGGGSGRSGYARH